LAGIIGLALALTAPMVAHAAAVPVRVRIIKGSRQGPLFVDPQLADLGPQLTHLVYEHWEQVSQRDLQMEFHKPVSVPLPDGAALELTLLDARKDTVTFEVSVPQHKTRSRLTISKDKRIVHQVAEEKGNEAYFATIRPWP
jgi:hypothetical protein